MYTSGAFTVYLHNIVLYHNIVFYHNIVLYFLSPHYTTTHPHLLRFTPISASQPPSHISRFMDDAPAVPGLGSVYKAHQVLLQNFLCEYKENATILAVDTTLPYHHQLTGILQRDWENVSKVIELKLDELYDFGEEYAKVAIAAESNAVRYVIRGERRCHTAWERKRSALWAREAHCGHSLAPSVNPLVHTCVWHTCAWLTCAWLTCA